MESEDSRGCGEGQAQTEVCVDAGRGWRGLVEAHKVSLPTELLLGGP